jgi:hypothetical protein
MFGVVVNKILRNIVDMSGLSAFKNGNSQQQGSNKQYQEHDEQHFRYAYGCCFYSGETEDRRYNSDDEKYD